jgi:hypothetical protein
MRERGNSRVNVMTSERKVEGQKSQLCLGIGTVGKIDINVRVAYLP